MQLAYLKKGIDGYFNGICSSPAGPPLWVRACSSRDGKHTLLQFGAVVVRPSYDSLPEQVRQLLRGEVIDSLAEEQAETYRNVKF